jgi:hypothetical protein
VTITALLKDSLGRSEVTQRGAAKLMGISPQYLHDVIAGRRRLTPELLSLWVNLVETMEKEELRQSLSILGAEADGWDTQAIYEGKR